jgi:hypothetical protein
MQNIWGFKIQNKFIEKSGKYKNICPKSTKCKNIVQSSNKICKMQKYCTKFQQNPQNAKILYKIPTKCAKYKNIIQNFNIIIPKYYTIYKISTKYTITI